ncbi:MAG: 1,4-dihydroxy-2-naphthoate polyprenyltransferase [candidate division Zixibacteria bacterium]|nr:1,4-dihydroxy-2-naphthoate polyprenyltransferase [candidate division Zixibacteria bacterium]
MKKENRISQNFPASHKVTSIADENEVPKTYSKSKIWLLAIRPKTLWAAIAPVIIGTAMAYEAGSFQLLAFLAALFGGTMIQIGTNLANDYFDFKKGADSQRELGPTRVTQAGLVSPTEIKTAMVLAFGLAFLAGIYLVYLGGWPIVAIGILSITFGVLYTATKLALGYSGLADFFVLVFFGPVAVGGTFYVQTLEINLAVILAGLAPGLFSVAILTVNNLRDIETDKIAGKKTLAVRFGPTFAKAEYVVAIIIASLVPLILWQMNNQHFEATIAAAVILLALRPIRKVIRNKNRTGLNPVLTQTAQILLLYSLLFSIGWLI